MRRLIKQIGVPLCILLFHPIFLIQSTDICYWRNQTSLLMISCNDGCCMGIAASPQSACCANTSWTTLAIPIFLVIGICLLAICLVYFRPLLKNCLCGGCELPCEHRTRITSANSMSANANPVYNINNDDLPDYETISKDSRPKDITPPPYNFVTTHPGDFGLESRVPSAPPQYRSRTNSTTTVRPIPPVQS
ncbi:hypothetical protein I4U23_018518 [Adineta vaga]|nr:hypothetical protein I4U23_018518 [Adineta vaga]